MIRQQIRDILIYDVPIGLGVGVVVFSLVMLISAVAKGNDPPAAWSDDPPVAWTTPDSSLKKQWVRPDGVYEEGADGVWRKTGVSGVTPSAPFGPAGTTPTTGARVVGSSPPPGPAPGSFGGGTGTGVTSTYAPAVTLPGATSGCPGGNCPVPSTGRRFR